MRQFDCPQCSAPIPFETPGGVFAICPNCRSMVVRKDASLEAIGKMAELPPDYSPLQIGARGAYKDKRFKLLGRLRIRWDDGAWDEWYADFGNNSYGWVAETQGFFMISEAAPLDPELAKTSSHLQEGQELEIAGSLYHVADIKKATAAGGEGELPFVAVPGETWTGIDFVSQGKGFAGLEWHEQGLQLFIGSSAQPEEIQWEGLKAVPGWNGEPVPIERRNSQALTCPNCGGTVQMRAAGLTTTLACSHCGSLIDVHQERAAIGQKVLAVDALMPPPLPLGKRGTLRGVEWEILGCLWRKDAYSMWQEMLLYNPWHGFSWLTQYAGHWTYVKRVPDDPSGGEKLKSYEGASFRIFANEATEVTQVTGEFYWRVRIGELATVIDYVAPPRILSAEVYPELHEVTWFAGEYIQPQELEKAFEVKLPAPSGISLNQPNPYGERCRNYFKMAFLALVVMILLELLFSAVLGRRQVLQQTVTVQQPGVTAAAITSQSFDLRSSRSAHVALQSETSSPVPAMTAQLVNEASGTVYPLSVPVDNYEGSSDIEALSTLPSVPAGKYHLALLPLPSSSLPVAPVHVTIQQGGLFTSNFVFCLIALFSWPIIAGWRYMSFETKRWAQSDFGSSSSSS